MPRLIDGEPVVAADRYLSDMDIGIPRDWLWSETYLESWAGYGDSFCLLRRLLSSILHPEFEIYSFLSAGQSKRCATKQRMRIRVQEIHFGDSVPVISTSSCRCDPGALYVWSYFSVIDCGLFKSLSAMSAQSGRKEGLVT